MPTAVAALATVPCSPTCKVAACFTRPMQHACGDSPVKSADGVNATPMPSALSRAFMLTLSPRFTRGSETLRAWTGPTVPPAVLPPAVLPPAASLAVIALSADAAGVWQPPAPEGGSSASITSLPPR